MSTSRVNAAPTRRQVLGLPLKALSITLLLVFATASAAIAEDSPAALATAAAALSKPSDFQENDDGNLRLDVRGRFLFVEGTINGTSLEETTRALDDHPTVDTVVLTSVPGSMDDEVNLATGRLVRARGLTTLLPARAMVASGGTDLFLSGERRILVTGAETSERPAIGVHSWAAVSGGLLGSLFGEEVAGKDVPRDDEQHQLYLAYYRSLGIPEDFYWFTLEAAPADGMHWMTDAEIERFGLATDIVSAPDAN